MIQLISLHVWLYFEKMTTYEFIVVRREKMKALFAIQNASNQQVISETNN